MIDLSHNVAIAQLIFVLFLIVVLLLFLAFGKIERQGKSRRL